MATLAEIQGQLDPQGTGRRIKIMRTEILSASAQDLLCEGGTEYPGRTRWCRTNPTESAADQATAIRAAMASEA